MTRAEGEIFFKRFHGHHYHMWHDEPAKYKEYCKLHITKMTENKWRLQKISDLFADIQAEPASAWVRIGSIIKIMHALKKIPKDLPEQLLDALDFATTLDIRQRILIMEDMEGRNDKENNNAGYALFRSRKKDYGRLHDIMARMMELSDKDRDDIDCLTAEGKIGWTDTYARYLRTADRCERAEAKYLI